MSSTDKDNNWGILGEQAKELTRPIELTRTTKQCLTNLKQKQVDLLAAELTLGHILLGKLPEME